MQFPRLRLLLPKVLAAIGVTAFAAGSSLVFFIPSPSGTVAGKTPEEEVISAFPETPTPHETEGVHKAPTVPKPIVSKKPSAPTQKAKATPRPKPHTPPVRPSVPSTHTARPSPVVKPTPKPTSKPKPTPIPTPKPAPKPTPTPPPANTVIRAQVIALINQQRAAVGVGQLASNSNLSDQCQTWTTHMDSTHNMVHSNMTYGGEIIAMGYNTAASVVQAWLNSPPHKAIMLSPNFTLVGSGFVNGYWTVQFG